MEIQDAHDDEDNNTESNDYHEIDNDTDEDRDFNFTEEDIGNDLKSLYENHEFVSSIIEAYKQQEPLWNKNKISSNISEGYEIIRKLINKKYNINTNVKYIKLLINRLRASFIYHYRREQGKINGVATTLWYYDQLTFLIPYIRVHTQTTISCNRLSEEQFLTLIKLIKKNECLWNEENIYHTSAEYKQEALQSMVTEFSGIHQMENLTVQVMKGLVDDLKKMAMKQKQVIKIEQSLDNFSSISNCYSYKDLRFLMPHVGPFTCSHCRQSFSDIYVFKFHVSKHEGTKPFKCMVCQKEISLKKEFVYHLRRHTKECPFKCDCCDKSFPSRKEWRRHVIKHGPKPFVCEQCADSFYTQHQLNNHMKNHANIRDHVCSSCGKGFTHRGLLRQHLQTHNKTQCTCTLCNKVYTNPRSFRRHFVRVHELHQESSLHATNSCKICLITFSTIQEAKQHRKEHKQSLLAKRKHVCDICGQEFAYPRNLADHKKIHSNVRDQVCDTCGKAFTSTNILNQHKKVHNGQKFACSVCGKDYSHYRGLCRHITKAHGTNVKEFCSVIEKEGGEHIVIKNNE
ncbi:uncharacterized protein isoform X2 [Musca autumnalis]